MSDIKRFLLRIPEDLYDSLDLQAMKLNMSINSLIVERLTDNAGQVPKRMKAIEATRKIAAILPNTYAGSDIPTPPPKPKGCDECGALIGHQKWCKCK